MALNKAARRQIWLASVERAIIAQRADLSGRMDWDTLIHLYNTGMTVDDAATRYLATR